MQCLASGKVYPPITTGGVYDLTKNTYSILKTSYYEGGTDPDLVLKITNSGVTFLRPGDFKPRYNSRYVGSNACAIDHDGHLWTKAKELQELSEPGRKLRDGKADHDVVMSVYKKGQRLPETAHGGARYLQANAEEIETIVGRKRKKKNVGVPPDVQMLLQCGSPSPLANSGAISELLPDQQNLPPHVEKNLKNPRKKCYSVDKGKVRQRIYGYLNTKKGSKRLFFWTVSFPEGTPDDTCYRAFNTWLTKLRHYKLLREYLWIAERQEGVRLKDKNKQPTHTIHFHIAIPHFMDVRKANAMMRGTLKGYAKKGMLPGVVCDLRSKSEFYKSSIAKYNGVDICKHRTTRKPINFAVKQGGRALANYLTKYVTKNDAGQKDDKGELIAPGFEHLAWHCSRGFSRLFTGITCTLSEFKQAGFGGYLNRVRAFHMEFATFVPWLFGPPPALIDHLYKLNSFIQTLFDNEPPT